MLRFFSFLGRRKHEYLDHYKCEVVIFSYALVTRFGYKTRSRHLNDSFVSLINVGGSSCLRQLVGRFPVDCLLDDRLGPVY